MKLNKYLNEAKNTNPNTKKLSKELDVVLNNAITDTLTNWTNKNIGPVGWDYPTQRDEVLLYAINSAMGYFSRFKKQCEQSIKGAK